MEQARRESTNIDETNRNIGSNVHACMVKRGVKGIEIADLLDLEPQSLSARLHGRTPFKAHELDIIAERLDIEAGILFQKTPIILVVSRTGQMELPLDSLDPTLELVKSA